MGSTDLGLFSMGSIRVWTHEPISRVGCQWVDTRARVFYQQSECNCEELHNYMEPCRPCCGGESKGRHVDTCVVQRLLTWVNSETTASSVASGWPAQRPDPVQK